MFERLRTQHQFSGRISVATLNMPPEINAERYLISVATLNMPPEINAEWDLIHYYAVVRYDADEISGFALMLA
ncbi:unnamed protein product [Onchocerca flexuosa]|uniref:GNAT family N-acetyltransferase n=1 Tax=Onchocerca flexuosa TaxID=387005 RepID=A0A183I5S4_9BILA|nr:unnamed protein product [Onchocerca flexuosa]